MNFKISNQKKNAFGSCVGTFDLELTDFGMTIRNVRLMCTDGKEWLAFPSKEYMDKEGHKRWMNHVVFSDAEKGEVFKNAVIEEALGKAVGVKEEAAW